MIATQAKFIYKCPTRSYAIADYFCLFTEYFGCIITADESTLARLFYLNILE